MDGVDLNRTYGPARYETAVIRGEPFKWCKAGRPKATKSWGRKWSGGTSVRCLLMTGSNVVGKFSLSSSDRKELEKGSGENDEGLVGVSGKSSDRSETDVVALIGVLAPDIDGRVGVIGRVMKDCRTNRPPWR